MNEGIQKLLKAGDALTRAMGHSTTCRKVGILCSCGAGGQQAQAMADWDEVTEEFRIAAK